MNAKRRWLDPFLDYFAFPLAVLCILVVLLGTRYSWNLATTLEALGDKLGPLVGTYGLGRILPLLLSEQLLLKRWAKVGDRDGRLRIEERIISAEQLRDLNKRVYQTVMVIVVLWFMGATFAYASKGTLGTNICSIVLGITTYVWVGAFNRVHMTEPPPSLSVDDEIEPHVAEASPPLSLNGEPDPSSTR